VEGVAFLTRANTHCFKGERLSDEEFGFVGARTALTDVVIGREARIGEERDFVTSFRRDFSILANNGGAREGLPCSMIGSQNTTLSIVLLRGIIAINVWPLFSEIGSKVDVVGYEWCERSYADFALAFRVETKRA
jgi:hypothetical protein